MCCLVVTVLSEECEISKCFSWEFSTVEFRECEFRECVVGIVGVHDAGCVA